MTSIEADTNVLVQVTVHWHNHNYVYIAQPTKHFENSCSNISENTNYDNDKTGCLVITGSLMRLY